MPGRYCVESDRFAHEVLGGLALGTTEPAVDKMLELCKRVLEGRLTHRLRRIGLTDGDTLGALRRLAGRSRRLHSLRGRLADELESRQKIEIEAAG